MSGPVRIQLSRAKGFDLQALSRKFNGRQAVKVDRTTRWGNPFSAQAAIDCGFARKDTAHAFVVECFRTWIGGGPKADSMWMGPASDEARRPFQDLSALRGKNLACWCKPGSPCHADVLLELANTPTPNASGGRER